MNVMLLTVDSMRADMPWAGYEREIAPNMTKLANEGVVYERAYTLSSYTAKSVSGMLSGRYPSTLYRGGTFFTAFADANVWFTEPLQKAGVRTLGGHAHGYFDRGKNLRQGFDVWEITPGIGFKSTTDESITSDKMTDMAIAMLEKPENGGKQFFMWLHYMDPHDQYHQHEESPKWGKRARDRFDSEMFFTDLHIGRLLDFCAKQPWWDHTAVIISADHGEAFGEHQMYKHAFALWEVLTHVPLLFKVPGAKPQRISERRSHLDLAPTIMELMGHELIPSFMGKSMAPEIMGKAKPDNREPIVLDLPADTNNPPTKAVIQGDFKMIKEAGGRHRLFNLTKDPGERQDLAKTDKENFARMKELLDSTWEKIPTVKPYGGNKLVGGGTANGPTGPE